MRFSATIIAKRDPGLVFTLGLPLQERDLVPELFLCEGSGGSKIAARVIVDCDKSAMLSLVARWQANCAVHSVQTEPSLLENILHVSPAVGPHA